MNEPELLTKDSIIMDILDREDADDILPLFLEYGMHCVGCIASTVETVGEACELHEIDADEFVRAANLLIVGKCAQDKFGK